MPIIEEHYSEVDWLPCPDCWDEDDYESEQWTVTDSYGSIELNADGTPWIDPDWVPDYRDPAYGQGYFVIATKLPNGEWDRCFYGCARCGGSGSCYKAPKDDYIGTGKSWNQWVIVEGGVTIGTGMIKKDDNK